MAPTTQQATSSTDDSRKDDYKIEVACLMGCAVQAAIIVLSDTSSGSSSSVSNGIIRLAAGLYRGKQMAENDQTISCLK